MTAGKVLLDLGIGSNWSYEGSSEKKTLDIDIFYAQICFKEKQLKMTGQSYLSHDE